MAVQFDYDETFTTEMLVELCLQVHLAACLRITAEHLTTKQVEYLVALLNEGAVSADTPASWSALFTESSDKKQQQLLQCFQVPLPQTVGVPLIETSNEGTWLSPLGLKLAKQAQAALAPKQKKNPRRK